MHLILKWNHTFFKKCVTIPTFILRLTSAFRLKLSIVKFGKQKIISEYLLMLSFLLSTLLYEFTSWQNYLDFYLILILTWNWFNVKLRFFFRSVWLVITTIMVPQFGGYVGTSQEQLWRPQEMTVKYVFGRPITWTIGSASPF